MELKLATWREIEAYLTNRTDIIIPIGSTEQHGPMGFIGTDFICPELIALKLAELDNSLVAPTLPIGMSQHHLNFPGSLTLRPTTLIAMIKDIIQSLAGQGFTHIFFLNGHGGNVNSMNAAFSEIYAEHSLNKTPTPLQLTAYSWYEGQSVQAISEQYFKGVEGHHATPSELSLSFFAYPEDKKTAQMKPRVAPENTFTDCFNFADHFPDGRIASDSSLASIEIGQQLLEAAVKDLRPVYKDFLKQ